jgi:hypothetical protein
MDRNQDAHRMVTEDQARAMAAEAAADVVKATEARMRVERCALYVLQRSRIMKSNARCRSCTAWYASQLGEFGY